MGRKSRSRSSSSGKKEKEKEKKKDKEKKEKEKDKGSKRSRSGRAKDKEKERRFKDGQSDKVKERDKKDRDKDKEKDRDKDREKDKEREKDRKKGRSHSRSADEVSSEDEGGSFKLWPIVVATSRRMMILLAPASELHPDVVPMEIAVSSKSRQAAPEKPAMFRPAPTIALPGPHSLALPSAQSQGLGVHSMPPPAMPSTLAAMGMAGMAPPQPGFNPMGRPPSHYTGAALAQQHGKTQICFNFVGGRCFRDNCRFMHIGPKAGGAAPAPAFTGLRGGFS